jgi:hypothetical protein
MSLAAVLAVACSHNAAPSTAPATALTSLTIGPASAANPGGTVTMAFGGSLMAGMERYVDLHQGTTVGAPVPMTCAMSAERVMITCTPNAALTPGARYTLQMGGGMLDGNGSPVDMCAGMGMGGAAVCCSSLPPAEPVAGIERPRPMYAGARGKSRAEFSGMSGAPPAGAEISGRCGPICQHGEAVWDSS